jgi:hypothetical protein
MKLYTNAILTERYQSKYSGLNFTANTISKGEPKFPTVLFRKLQGQESGSDLDGEDVNAVISNIQIDVTTITSQTDAQNIADAVMEAMKKMRYRIVGDMFSDNDATKYRIVMRFNRLIGHDDII